MEYMPRLSKRVWCKIPNCLQLPVVDLYTICGVCKSLVDVDELDAVRDGLECKLRSIYR